MPSRLERALAALRLVAARGLSKGHRSSPSSSPSPATPVVSTPATPSLKSEVVAAPVSAASWRELLLAVQQLQSALNGADVPQRLTQIDADAWSVATDRTLVGVQALARQFDLLKVAAINAQLSTRRQGDGSTVAPEADWAEAMARAQDLCRQIDGSAQELRALADYESRRRAGATAQVEVRWVALEAATCDRLHHALAHVALQLREGGAETMSFPQGDVWREC